MATKAPWDPALVLKANPRLRPTPHPILPNLTDEQLINKYLVDEPTTSRYIDWLNDRELLLRQSSEDGDPFRHGFELDHWKDADRIKDAEELVWLIMLGGNRSAKSEYCGKRVVQDALAHPDTVILCLAETEISSQMTQQTIIWKYLPVETKALNGTRDRRRVYYINYSPAHGFSEQRIVLPNRSKIIFSTYNAETTKFEGVEFGSQKLRCIGAWADESLTPPWFQMLDRRLRYRNACGLWSFTPVKGMTPTIRTAVGDGQILESKPSELLPSRVNVAGLPVGHMPYIQEAAIPRAKVIYFHSNLNPFGNSAGSYYKQIAEMCNGKPDKFTMRVAYGYTTDTAGKAFPLFGHVNVVRPEDLPVDGTNYQLIDPAGARRFSCIWVRVTAGFNPKVYIYRDWPDQQRYGEWAIPTERELSPDSNRGWDGDPGPAQQTANWGVAQYKEEFEKVETVDPAKPEKDPHRARLATRSGLSMEDILVRYIDSRAGKDQHTALQSGTCLLDDFAKTTTSSTGKDQPPMYLELASGVRAEAGLSAIEALLYWEPEKPFDPVMNCPKLYVSNECHQVIWAMSNFTGRGGEKGACKDFVDLVRYAAIGELLHVSKNEFDGKGGGSY